MYHHMFLRALTQQFYTWCPSLMHSSMHMHMHRRRRMQRRMHMRMYLTGCFSSVRKWIRFCGLLMFYFVHINRRLSSALSWAKIQSDLFRSSSWIHVSTSCSMTSSSRLKTSWGQYHSRVGLGRGEEKNFMTVGGLTVRTADEPFYGPAVGTTDRQPKSRI